jgi:hypothetical protein
MLFLLAMEPLHRLFKKAQETNLLDKVSKGCHEFRISLYADNAAVFIKPTAKDLQVTNTILELFVGASGLVTNMDKTQFYPIQCSHIDLEFLSQHNCKVTDFPCCYLGLPLHYKKLPRSFMHEVIQKIANRLPGWKRGLMSYPGREMLIKSVLSAMPTYFLSIFKMSKWGFRKIDKYKRGFLWKGHDYENIRGGHCLVNWQKCSRPRWLGGLGIKELNKFSRSLRLKWLWYNWDHQQKPWKHLLKITDQTDRSLFFTSTVMIVGDGKNTPFWESRRLNGASPKELAPNLYQVTRFKNRNIHAELRNCNCIRSLGHI